MPEKSKIVQQLSYACQKPEYKIVTVHNIWTQLDFGQQYSEIATLTFIEVDKYQKKSILLDFLRILEGLLNIFFRTMYKI